MKLGFAIGAASVIDRPCLMIDSRPGLTPIESVLMVVNKSDKKHCEKLVKPLNMGKRLVVVAGEEFSFPKAWLADCWKRGFAVSEFVHKPLAEDLQYLDIFYVLYSCRHRNWVNDRLQSHIFYETGLKEMDDLALMLNQYLEKSRYTLSPFGIINKANGAKYLSGSYTAKVVYKMLENRDALSEKLLEKVLRTLVILHRLFSQRRYLSVIRSFQKFSNAQLQILNKKGESSSGCVFLRIKKGSNDWFIKGNECPLFHSIKNEINVQKRLFSNKTKGHYLYMNLYDQNSCWIGYPFENKRTLRHVLRERILTEDEQRRLGFFIITTLDELYAMNIVHRDYRVENIMADEAADGSIKSFMLFDFGCSVMDGIDIWGKESFWNRYLSGQVCGEGRYNERIVDDAAAAYTVYMRCGGSPNDETAKEIEKRIGRLIA